MPEKGNTQCKGLKGLFETCLACLRLEWNEPERKVIGDEVREVMGYSILLSITPKNLDIKAHIPLKKAVHSASSSGFMES